MITSDKNVKSDLELLEAAVINLNRSVKQCGLNWSDSKYQVLSESIKELAASSKSIMIIRNSLEKEIGYFKSLEEG